MSRGGCFEGSYRLTHGPTESEALAHLRGPGDTAAEAIDDLDRAVHQLRVRCEDAPRQVEVVLEPDPQVSAEEHRLRHHRHLHPPDAESRPDAAGREVLAEGHHRRGR